MTIYRRPDGTIFEYEDTPRNRYGRHDRYPIYDLPPQFDPYGYDEYDDYEPEYFYARRGHGCLPWLIVLVTILACMLLILMTVHPQGFQLIHF